MKVFRETQKSEMLSLSGCLQVLFTYTEIKYAKSFIYKFHMWTFVGVRVEPHLQVAVGVAVMQQAV